MRDFNILIPFINYTSGSDVLFLRSHDSFGQGSMWSFVGISGQQGYGDGRSYGDGRGGSHLVDKDFIKFPESLIYYHY